MWRARGLHKFLDVDTCEVEGIREPDGRVFGKLRCQSARGSSTVDSVYNFIFTPSSLFAWLVWWHVVCCCCCCCGQVHLMDLRRWQVVDSALDGILERQWKCRMPGTAHAVFDGLELRGARLQFVFAFDV